MANENLRIDENSRWVLGALANDGSGDIKNARINPVTGALIVEANVTSSNTMIGSTIPGGIDHSVLFLGLGGTLDQDPTHFYYDYTSHFLGLGTTTPSATLSVVGTVRFDLGGDATGDIFYRDAMGFVTPLPIGAAGQVLTVSGGGLPSWNTISTTGYNQIQDNGVNLPQRSILNFVNFFTVTDSGGVKTNVDIDVTALGADPTFISTLEANLDLALISGQINLTTQVTGILPIANGGTNSSTALSGSTIMISNGTQIVQGTAGTTTTVLHGNAAGAPTYSAVDLTTDVTGILPVPNGGTGANTLTGVLVGNGVSAVTAVAIAQGDLFYGSAVGVLSALAKDTNATRYLSNTGASNNPAWAQINLANGVTGILPLANGGTGSNLSDPGANKLWGWDDTDNSIGFWTIGSGLSYDHGTHTISAAGSLYSVNADETVVDWYSVPILAPFPGGAGETPWSFVGSPTNTQYATGVTLKKNNTAQIEGRADMGYRTFGTTFKARLRWESQTFVPTADVRSGIGFGEANSITDNNDSIAFIWYNGNVYSHTADNGSHTSNIVQAYASSVRDIYEIVVDGTTNAFFYINGTLVDTINTTLPSTDNPDIVVRATDSLTGNDCGFDFVSHLTYSEMK